MTAVAIRHPDGYTRTTPTVLSIERWHIPKACRESQRAITNPAVYWRSFEHVADRIIGYAPPCHCRDDSVQLSSLVIYATLMAAIPLPIPQKRWYTSDIMHYLLLWAQPCDCHLGKDK